MERRPRILVVEDDPAVQAAVRRALLYEGYGVTVAADGPAALREARDGGPDLVILDLMLPGLDGLEVCRRLRAASALPVLMLTARDAVDDRVRGLDSGADDYLVKPFAYEELLARVRALLRRGGGSGGAVLRYADLRLDVATREAWRGGRPLRLTAKEFDLLAHFVRCPRLVLSREQLLDAVWGGELDVGSNVVDVYVGYLRQKLEEGGEPCLLQTVRSVGYALREE
jgi:two-component system response regulator MprA